MLFMDNYINFFLKSNYRMSLLPLINACRSEGQSNPEYYFTLSGGPAAPARDSSFVATGTGTPPNGGSFVAISEPIGAPPNSTNAFVIADLSGVRRWALGVNDAEAGANSGSDFILAAYDDSGAFLSTPLSINRASGQVGVNTGLTVDGNALVSGNLTINGFVDLSGSNLWANTIDVNTEISTGLPTTVGGGNVEVVGTLGVSRVFDPIYNRPVPGTEVLISSFDNLGAAVGVPVSYTASVTGLYTLTMEAKIFSTGLGFTNGVSVAVGYLQPAMGTITDSYLALDSVADPSALTIPGQLVNSYVKDIVAVITLTAGTSYTAGLSSFSMNLGTGGGIKFFIQPIIA